MLSKYFIDRPVLASVIGIIIVILGSIAALTLPVSQFPRITPPTVVISASYPGADAKTIADNVISPMEAQISGADGLMYTSSSVSGISGAATITCTFEVGVNLDIAAVDIQNRVNLAQPLLPAIVKTLGISVQKRTADILMIVALSSPEGTMSDVAISNYALANLVDEIKRIPGAGRAQIFGQRDYAMRVWLNPDKMASMGVTAMEINAVLAEQNLQVSPGRVGQAPMPDGQQLTVMLTAKGRLATPEEFEQIIVKAKSDGTTVRLLDVAKVELGTANYEFFGRLNGKPAALIGIFADADANALTTAEAVYKTMDKLSRSFPAGLSYKVPYDTTKFVKISMIEVTKTLLEALLLVVCVVYLFLQSWRASLIPLIAVPVSLMGAFIGMYILGYSINTLTLFGMVLAIGIVVDDAIIVVENMERIMQTEGLTPKEAAKKAMTQVTSPIIAIVLVLCAVFIPATFMGGMIGQLYKQFAMTIAVSVIFSGFTALTLSPALGGLILREHERPPHRIFVAFNGWFIRLTEKYVSNSAWLVRRWAITATLYASAFVCIFFIYKSVPTSFVPMEDQGFFISVANLPDAATIDRTAAVVEKAEATLLNTKGVENVIAMVGMNILAGGLEPNGASVFTRLSHWDERTTPQTSLQSIMGIAMGGYSQIKEAMVMAFAPPPIRGLGITGGFQCRLLMHGEPDMEKLAVITQQFMAKAKERPELAGIMSQMRPQSPTLFVDVDRERAKALGINISDIFTTLQSTIGYTNINQFDKQGRTYWVQIQSEGKYRQNPDDIGRAFVRSSNGKMVPLSSVLTVKNGYAPARIEHFNGLLATQVMGASAPGYSSGQALTAMEELAEQFLPPEVDFAWEGAAYQQKRVGDRSGIVYLFALVMVFLILSAQYEKWTMPIAVILVVPFGILGALTAVFITNLTNDVYFQIGLLTLIGLSSKNAILVIEFAEDQRRQGRSIYDATLAAARLRYRPMMMTSLAFIFGVLPLVISTGAGAESRHSIGTGIMGGMIAATFVERFFIPWLYYWVAMLRERFFGGTHA